MIVDAYETTLLRESLSIAKESLKVTEEILEISKNRVLLLEEKIQYQEGQIRELTALVETYQKVIAECARQINSPKQESHEGWD